MSVSHRFRPSIKIDGVALGLMAVMAATQGLAIAAYGQFGPLLDMPEQARMTNPLSALPLFGFIVAEVLLFVGAYRLLHRLPKWLRELLNEAVKYCFITIAVLFFAWALTTPAWPLSVAAALAVVVAYPIWRLYQRFDLQRYVWLLHNTAAFGLSVGAVWAISPVFSPEVAVVFMVLMMAYDYSAVSLSGIMDDLIDASASINIPNYYIIPASLRVDYGAVTTWLQERGDDKPQTMAGIIGAGDFILPSLLVMAAVAEGATVAGGFAAVGSIAALGWLRAASNESESGLPALLWVNTGAIGGYAVGFLWVMLL